MSFTNTIIHWSLKRNSYITLKLTGRGYPRACKFQSKTKQQLCDFYIFWFFGLSNIWTFHNSNSRICSDSQFFRFFCSPLLVHTGFDQQVEFVLATPVLPQVKLVDFWKLSYLFMYLFIHFVVLLMRRASCLVTWWLEPWPSKSHSWTINLSLFLQRLYMFFVFK